MDEALIQQGADLMLFGMGSVAVFLTLLVVAMVLMSAVVNRWFPEAEPAAPENGRTPAAPGGASGQVDRTTLAAIKAAIEQHRARR